MESVTMDSLSSSPTSFPSSSTSSTSSQSTELSLEPNALKLFLERGRLGLREGTPRRVREDLRK